jgi:hypothetical protein
VTLRPISRFWPRDRTFNAGQMSTAPVIPATLSAKDAATYVGLGRTVFLRDVAPILPRVRLSAGRVGFKVDDLNRWINERTETPEES